MNYAMLNALRAHKAHIPPVSAHAQTIVSLINLNTTSGILCGFIFSDNDIVIDENGFGYIRFSTKDSIHYIDIVDIKSFSTYKNMSFEDMRKWQDPSVPDPRKIGFA